MGRRVNSADCCILNGIVYDTKKLQEEFRNKIFEIMKGKVTQAEMYKRLFDFAFGMLQGTDIPFDTVYIAIKKAIFYALVDMEEQI